MDDSRHENVELTSINYDVESQVTLRRKRRWDTAFTHQNSTDAQTSSSESIKSHWSVNLLVRWTPSWNRQETTLRATTLSLSKSEEDFLLELTGESALMRERDPCTSLEGAHRWYTSFLEAKIRDAWASLFQPVLIDTHPFANTPNIKDLSLAFQFLTSMVRTFQKDDLALVEVVDELYNKELLKETDSDRSQATQLGFAAFGWITMLYSPELKPKPNLLQIEEPPEHDGSVRRSHRRLQNKSEAFTKYEQSLENVDQPLRTLLGYFGEFIPQPAKVFHSGHSTPLFFRGRQESNLEPSLLCFHGIRRTAGIKIQWVDCLPLHLEFDRRTKTLKLFRFPSLCLIMCCIQEKKPALQQLFQDKFAASMQGNPDENDPAQEYFKEVLLTYRLIFGQSKPSYSSFHKLMTLHTWEAALDKDPDPLLAVLCGQSCEGKEAAEIYDAVGAPDVANHYCPLDFPYLGRRLGKLQNYVKAHNPHTIWGIWYDKRNPLAWWTFWAVIAVGIGDIFFGMIQSVLGAMQVVYARQQTVLSFRGSS